jgi:hypothetical protein
VRQYHRFLAHHDDNGGFDQLAANTRPVSVPRS